MSMFPNSNVRPIELDYGTDEKAVFNFFNTVYAWMAAGLGVTATVAFLVSQSQALMQALFFSPFMIVAFMLGAWFLANAVQNAALRISAAAGIGLFLLYAALLGAMLSGIFLVYQTSTLLASFGMTAGTFGVMSVYGYVTKRDLTKMGSILTMCVIGVFFASIVNVFLANSAMSWFITYAVLALFIGLTAYQTQKLKMIAIDSAHNADLAARYAVIGSLVLYVAFINMFLSVLRIMGDRR